MNKSKWFTEVGQDGESDWSQVALKRYKTAIPKPAVRFPTLEVCRKCEEDTTTSTLCPLCHHRASLTDLLDTTIQCWAGSGISVIQYVDTGVSGKAKFPKIEIPSQRILHRTCNVVETGTAEISIARSHALPLHSSWKKHKPFLFH